MNTTQPYKLLQFIKNINIDTDSGLIVDTHYSSFAYTNRSYPLSSSVSKTAQTVQKIVAKNQVFTYDYNTDITGLIPFFEGLNKSPEYQYLYQAFQAILLESFALVYSVENLGDNQVGFTNDDMNRVHSSITGLINNLYTISEDGVYDAIISLRDLDSNMLYIYSTFGSTDYVISANNDNREGRVNLIPNSSFSYLDDYYNLKGSNDKVSSVTTVLGSNTPFELVYTGSDINGVTIDTRPISAYPDAIMTLRALSNFTITIYATDHEGNLVPSFIDNDGHNITDGIIAESTMTSPNVQVIQSFTIPVGVSYIVVEFKIKQAVSSGDDRISQLMLTNGSFIGTYVEGAVL